MSTSISGEILVYAWSNFRVRIGDQVLTAIVSLDAKRTNYTTVGPCSILSIDDYGDLYDTLNYLDEIEIYMQDPEDLYTPNKVWGGYLSDKFYLQGNNHLLQITGKEYSYALFDQLYTHDYSTSTDIGEISQDIVEDNGLFTTASIPSVTGKQATLNFENERHWDALSKACNPVGYEFGVSLDQDAYVREILEAPNSPDDVSLGDNMILSTQQSLGDNVATDITIQGSSSAVSSQLIDTDAEDAYGRKKQILSILPEATSSTTTADYAATVQSNQTDPVIKYQLQTRALLHTDPNDNLLVSIEGTTMSSYYKVIEISHSINRNGNIGSTVSLNHMGLSSGDILLNLAKRYNRAEKKVWQ